MMFPERFSNLPAYAFPRLRALLDAHAPGGPAVHMTIGEPQHPFPAWVPEVLTEAAAGWGKYPPNAGTLALQDAIGGWIQRRYGVTLDPAQQILPLNGTREGLYNVAMALSPETKAGARPIILIPNPFYQVYRVAAASVGAEAIFVPATAESGFLPDYKNLPIKVLERTTLAYICSPSNPQGAVASRTYWQELIALAERYDFRIIADECYSEIYRSVPPPGALEIATEMGADPERVVIFHSLSKRSNLPGLRAGFAAGGPENLGRMKQLRDFAGAPLPLPVQAVATRAWDDEIHVAENRALYAEKYDIADAVFAGISDYKPLEAGFFLWLPVPDGEAATMKLWTETGIRVLPGAYLSHEEAGKSPGHGYIRVALVAPKEDIAAALPRLRDCLYK